jgi:signal transduction histidine kinase
MSGATEQGLRRLGLRPAIQVRSVVLLGAGVAALFQPGAPVPVVAGVLVALGVWSGWYLTRTPTIWLSVVDTALIVALCLTQRWSVPEAALIDSTNWVLVAVSITSITLQWYSSAVEAIVFTTVIVAAQVVGNAVAMGGFSADAVFVEMWTFGEAGLSRVLFLLVLAGAKAADRAAEESESLRRDAAVAAARRADEREHLAVLHDTAAATMLAVGTGTIGNGAAPWLAEQAARDLETLTRQPDSGDTDLVRLLDQVVRHDQLTVSTTTPDALPMPAAAAVAISAAARAALSNVDRHAGVAVATVVVSGDGDRVTVEVTDTGRGFVPDEVSAHRRGISMSIMERMALVGGHAEVASAPGAGTRVRLEWPS